MKKAKPAKTPARIVWNLIHAEMVTQGVTQQELARRAHVNKDTVCLDNKDPNRIPMSRLWVYFAALGIDPAVVLRPLAMEHAEHMIRREEPQC